LQIILKLHTELTRKAEHFFLFFPFTSKTTIKAMTSVPLSKMRILNKDEFFNFIELNITGDNQNFNKCDGESKFIDVDIFNIFAACFEASNPLFEFYGNTKYNSRNIIRLNNELQELKKKIELIESKDQLTEFLNDLFLGQDLIDEFKSHYIDWEKNWNNIKEILLVFNADITKLIDKCISEDRVLWVLGI